MQWLTEQVGSAEPDLVRSMVATFAQALMSAEADAVCGAPYGQPSPDRVNRRNGYRAREWDTRAGTIELAIPEPSATFNAWFVFMPAYLATTNVLPLASALGASLCGLLAAAIVAPVCGRLSDRFGRRPFMLAGAVAVCLLPLPAFALATRGWLPVLVLSSIAMGTAIGALAVLPAYLSERFPTTVRATGIGLTFGLATPLVGGTIPLIGSLLAANDAAIALPLLLTAIGVAGLAAALGAPETVPAARR